MVKEWSVKTRAFIISAIFTFTIVSAILISPIARTNGEVPKVHTSDYIVIVTGNGVFTYKGSMWEYGKFGDYWLTK